MSGFFSAWHFDGLSAARRTVEIQTIGENFYLVERERRHGPFAFCDLSYVGQQGDATVYSHPDRDGWRLGLSGPVPADLARFLPAKRTYGGFIDKLGLGPASLAFAVASAAVVGIVLLTPQWLAPFIPSSFEKTMGDTLVGDFGGRFCSTDKGKLALNKLVAALDDDPKDLQVEVAKIDMINAVALPGNKVILFDGLVKQASSPDEVAGVLAHEIGHVRERHVMQGLLRQMGLSLVLGGLDGNSSGLLNGALSMTYSRSSENDADTHSIKAMKKANISPIATADFFKQLASMDGSENVKANSITGYMSSHPLSLERKKRFERSVEKGRAYKPALTSAEWTELKTMCTQDKKAKSGFGFEFE